MSGVGPLADVTRAAGDVRFQGVKRTRRLGLGMSASDPACVKTLRCCYDSSVILGGIDGALR
jgi:hypothetical protein